MKSKKTNERIIEELEVKNNFRALNYHNGVIEIIWHPSIPEVDVDHLTKMREAIYKLGGGKKIPLLFTYDNVLRTSKKGAEYATSKEGVKYTLACALMVDSLSKILTFNFFQTFNRPIVPTKAFTNKVDAFRWLEKLKNKGK